MLYVNIKLNITAFFRFHKTGEANQYRYIIVVDHKILGGF